MMPQRDPIAGALRAYLSRSGEQEDDGVEDTPSSSSSSAHVVHTCARSNAVVRTLRIPWCDGHLEWKVSCM